MGALWWGAARLAKQAALVIILSVWWKHPEDQALWAIGTLTCYGLVAARIRPSTNEVVNKCELAGLAKRRAPNATLSAGRNAAPRICEIGSMLPHMPRTRNQEIGIFRRRISTMGITFP